jgi:membrane protease subunit HflK
VVQRLGQPYAVSCIGRLGAAGQRVAGAIDRFGEARQAYNKAVPLARGDKLKLIEEAEGFALDRVNRAHGDVARFRALLAEYQKAPAITRTRLYLESMRDVLPKLERRVIIDDSLRGILPVLGLERGGK